MSNASKSRKKVVYEFEIRSCTNCFFQTSPLLVRQRVNTESPSMEKTTRHIDQPTNRIIPNGPGQTCTRHQDDDQVTQPHTSTLTSAAVPSSSFPTRPGSSTPTDPRSKRLLKSRARRRIVKKSTNERRCTSFAQLPISQLLTDLMRCRPCRHTPR